MTVGSFGSTFATTVNKVETRQDEKKHRGGKKVRKKFSKVGGGNVKANKGHENGKSIKNNCSEILQLQKAHKDKTRQVVTTWNVSTFTTYLVNAIRTRGVGLT